LRIVVNGVLRSWSMLKEPLLQQGEKRLAIERESFPLEFIDQEIFEEQAFGRGAVVEWDSGEVEVGMPSPRHLLLQFAGQKISGNYELRRMSWYPGNRWLLTKKRRRQNF